MLLPPRRIDSQRHGSWRIGRNSCSTWDSRLPAICARRSRIENSPSNTSPRPRDISPRELCDDGAYAAFFTIFQERYCPYLGRSRTYELLAIVANTKSIEDSRKSTRRRVARHRAKKKAEASVTVTDAAPTEANTANTFTNTNAESAEDTKSEDIGGAVNDADDPAASAERRKAAMESSSDEDASPATDAVTKPGAEDSDLGHSGASEGDRGDAAHTAEVAVAAAAINRLDPVGLRSLLDQIAPEHKRALQQHFGARHSENANAEIGQLASECSAMLAHPEQHVDEMRSKLARIKRLTGYDKKSGKSKQSQKSNAQLDYGALPRGLGLAGPPGNKFLTMNMEPVGVDAAGNPIHALQQLPRGNRSEVH